MALTSLHTGESWGYFLVPLNLSGIPGIKSTYRAISVVGPDGTTDSAVSGDVGFTSTLDQYGMQSMTGIFVDNDTNIKGAVSLHAVLVYVDETAAGEYGTLAAAADAVTDPLIVNATLSSGAAFSPGDFVVFNDPATQAVTSGGVDVSVKSPLTYAIGSEDGILYVDSQEGFPAAPFNITWDDGTTEETEVYAIDGSSANPSPARWLINRGVASPAASTTTPSAHLAGTNAIAHTVTGGSSETVYSYEVAMIDDIVGGEFNFLRHWPGDPNPNAAIFSTLKAAHASGVTFFKLRTQSFTMKIDYSATVQPPSAQILAVFSAYPGLTAPPNTLPAEMDCVLPSACVVAIMMSVENYYGLGPWTVLPTPSVYSTDPTQLPPAPGGRTLAGQSYMNLIAPGTLAPQANVMKPPIRVQDSASVRCVYCHVDIAPAGAAIVVNVNYRAAGSTSGWTLLETLTIAAGQTNSYPDNNTPSERRMPYGINWPPPALLEDMELNFDIVSVGTAFAGSNLEVIVQT